LGDAGAVTSGDREIIEIIKILRNYGQAEKYNSRFAGINARMDPLQAGFLLIKLADLDRMNEARRRLAKNYDDRIKHPAVKKPPVIQKHTTHVYHQYTVLVSGRDRLREYLFTKGIETLVHYPLPPQRQKALEKINPSVFPEADYYSGHILSLPMDPNLSETEQYLITKTINEW
jgi:dTDP-4-amino-4,6-dideoxygalactose transaminase